MKEIPAVTEGPFYRLLSYPVHPKHCLYGSFAHVNYSTSYHHEAFESFEHLELKASLMIGPLWSTQKQKAI